MNEWNDTEVVIAFAKALNAVENVTRTQEADTGRYKYRYADLADVLDEVKRACQLFDLSVVQVPTAIDGQLAIETRVIHAEGGMIDFPPMLMKLQSEPQPFGSSLTYARRYSLLTIFGIAPEDDDGAAAQRAARAPEQYGGFRSGAEQRIHTELAKITSPDVRRDVQAAFREQFGSGLSDLPVSKHGDALEWVIETLRLRAEAAVDGSS